MKNDNALKELSNADPILARIIGTIEWSEIPSTHNVFHDLISCVVEQQIHYRSTKKIFKKMLSNSNLEFITPINFSDFIEKGIANYKLSTSKYETLNNVAEFWSIHPNLNWQQLTDEEVRNSLSKIKGIGSWTIDMILLYTLERLTIFPVDDFHLKEIMVQLYGLNPNNKLKKQMLIIAESWGMPTSLAVRYLLAWKSYTKKP